VIVKLQRIPSHVNGDDVHYGCSDTIKVVSWVLNEDTEAADVMALGREFHSGMILMDSDCHTPTDITAMERMCTTDVVLQVSYCLVCAEC